MGVGGLDFLYFSALVQTLIDLLAYEDEDGQDGQDGQHGADGEDGQDGQDDENEDEDDELTICR